MHYWSIPFKFSTIDISITHSLSRTSSLITQFVPQLSQLIQESNLVKVIELGRTFESLIVMNLSWRSSGILSLQNGQETLMDADILLLRLNHPDPLFPHRPDDPEDINVLRYENLLQYSV